MTIPTEHDLPACPIFDVLSPAEQEELLSRLQVESFGAGHRVLAEDQETSGLWIIKEGRCEVLKAMPDGSTRSLADLGPGATFGEMSFIDHAPNSATVRAASRIQAWTLSSEAYADLEAVAPRTAYSIIHAISVILAERLRRMDDWISQTVDHNCQDRHQEWSEFRAKLYTNWDL